MAVVLCCVLFSVAVLSAPVRGEECEQCGIQSLFGLYSLAVGDLAQEQQSALLRTYRATEISMYDIRQAAEHLNLSLRGVSSSLEKLAQIPGPKILHLQGPDHFTVLTAYRPGLVQLMEGGEVFVMSEDELSKRYTGHALVVQRKARDHGPRLILSEFAFAPNPAAAREGEAVEYPFTVTNSGDEELMLAQKAGCCGAPEILFSKNRLAPGESAECLLVASITRSSRLSASRGLLSNDPDQRLVYLTEYGYIPIEIAVYPPAVLMAGEKGATLSGEVFLRGPENLDPPEVSCERGAFTVAVTEEAVNRAGVRLWRIDLSTSGEQPGELRDRLNIRPGPDRPDLVVPLTARVWPDLEVSPPTLFLGFVAPRQSLEKTVVVSSRRRQEFTVIEVQSDTPAVFAGMPRRSNDKWVVPIHLDCGTSGVFRAKITIVTDVPGEATLTVPVYAQIVAPISRNSAKP